MLKLSLPSETMTRLYNFKRCEGEAELARCVTSHSAHYFCCHGSFDPRVENRCQVSTNGLEPFGTFPMPL